MYNIYNFHENWRTFLSALSLHFHFHFHNQRFASGFQEVEVVDEKIWVLGVDGFGTERARLAQGGSSAERARLAQGGFRGQFSKRNPFKRIFWKHQKFANFHLQRIRYFWVQNSKNPDPRKEFFFLGVNPPTCWEY